MVILFDLDNLPDDIFKILFATEQQEVVGKMLMRYMMESGGEIGKTEMGVFAMQLHEGKLIVRGGESRDRGSHEGPSRISYNKRQFYDRILTPMRGMGLIEYDLYDKKYKISDKFNKMMIRIGQLWMREIERQRLQQELLKGAVRERLERKR